MRRGSLSWKTLPQLFAKAGVVILNWPEDVPFPNSDKVKKGISSMKRDERVALLAAFNHTSHPLTFEKKYETGTSFNTIHQPLIDI